MNLDSCSGCHLHPAVGDSSPPVNPQAAFTNKLGGTDTLPSFLSVNGPVRETRFVRNADGSPDGGVHALFTISRGLGRRLFFLHDGRASDLITAIRAHQSPGSEANGVIANFNRLRETDKQDLLNFLRSL